MPSTAVHPGADHQVFWLLLDATKGSNTILPIHHPFWDQHRPGDRWNCHCSLEATDEHPTAPPKGFELRGNGPQPGLNENPAKTGRLFAQSHPYFPQSCAQCAFYQGGIASGFKNQEKDCERCKSISQIILNSDNSSLKTKKTDSYKYVTISDRSIRVNKLQTGSAPRSKNTFKNLLKHCYSEEEVDALVYMWEHMEELNYKGNEELGKNKDITNPNDLENIEKKKRKGYVSFNTYTFSYNNKEWILKAAVHKDGFEIPYTIYENRS